VGWEGVDVLSLLAVALAPRCSKGGAETSEMHETGGLKPHPTAQSSTSASDDLRNKNHVPMLH